MRTRTYYVLSHRLIGKYVKVDHNDICETVAKVEQATPFPTIPEVFSLIERRARKFAGADLGFDLHRVTAEILETPKIVAVVQL